MALPQTAVDHYRQQQAITVGAAEEVRRLWLTMSDDIDASWSRISQPVFDTVAAGQLAAARTGLAYVPAVLDEQGIPSAEVAAVNPQRFVGGTRDGRPLETLLDGAVYETKTAIGAGQSVSQALTVGSSWLVDAVLDSVRDANRQAVAGGITVIPAAQGWVRMLNPPSCKFCAVLAGKFFRWNQGFQSHRRCDCRHIPTAEAAAGDLTIDPYAYFNSLDTKMQNRLFGKNDAQSIRDGGDIYRVVNVRSRGLADDALKNTPGRNRGWQSRRWDSPSKMTIDDIYRSAKNRDDAIRLMDENGFITGSQRAGGNLRGNVGTGYAGQAGRGGTRKGATSSYRDALRTGVRDPLNPATQTAAERRLFDAVLAKRAVGQGRNPFGTFALTDADRELVERVYLREIAKISDSSQQIKDLARALGVSEAKIARKVAATSGGAGGTPPRPPRRGVPVPEDDDARRARQAALGIDTGGDDLEMHEIEFLERFLQTENVRWIPRDRTRFLPTNDFIWVNRGGLAVELKTVTPRYPSIQARIQESVAKAAAQGVAKKVFIINIGQHVLSDKLRAQLSLYNSRTTSAPIERLFVMDRNGLTEIDLKKK